MFRFGVFNIIKTCDLEHYVVQFAESEDGEYEDLTEPFDTYEEALEWAEHLRDDYHIITTDY